MARRYVWSRNLENDEAKARYGAVKNTTKRVVTPRKQTNEHILIFKLLDSKLEDRRFFTHLTVTTCNYHKSFYDNCAFCVGNCDPIKCGQQMLVVIWRISKNLQLNGAPWRWCQWTPKRYGAVINMRSGVHKMVRKCWSIKGCVRGADPLGLLSYCASVCSSLYIFWVYWLLTLHSLVYGCWRLD